MQGQGPERSRHCPIVTQLRNLSHSQENSLVPALSPQPEAGSSLTDILGLDPGAVFGRVVV